MPTGLKRFSKILLQGPEMRPCRDNLAHAGESCQLPDGALMFVKPEQVSGKRPLSMDEQIRDKAELSACITSRENYSKAEC